MLAMVSKQHSLEQVTERTVELLRAHRSSLIYGLRVVIGVLLIAACLEIFVFNFNYFRSVGYESLNLEDRLDLIQTDDEEHYRITAQHNTIEFHDLNKSLEDIYIDFDHRQPAQTIPVRIYFTDDAHETYFYSTKYTEGVPETNVATNNLDSQFIYIRSTGIVDDLKIEFGDEDTSYPILLNTIIINAHQPFDFNSGRFWAVAGILLLIWVFRPHSSIYRCYLTTHPRKTKAAIVAVTTLEVLLISSYLFFGSNLVGVATPNYNSGSWDGTGPVTVYEVGGDNAQQYAELARSMAHGQLSLEEEPPQWLVDMDNPYDKGARDELQKQTGEEYLFDVAFYEGKYYVYFGVVPVLLFYLPFFLLTGANFPTAIGVWLCLIAFILGCTALLDRFARYHFKQVSLGLFLLLQVPLIMCSGILYLAKFPTFYSLPIALALAFTVWGLYCWMRGRASERAYVWYVVGSLCMALVAGCRPQLLVFSLLAFPLFWRKFITERHIATPKGIKEFICLIAPYIVVAIGIMLYNKARFGSLTDFGANYNLTVNDMTQRGMNSGRFAPALFAYFLQTPTTTAVFPWIQPVTFETTYMGQTIREVTFGGILACLPVLWVLAFTRRILSYRLKVRSTNTITGVVIIMLLSGLLVGLLDAQMAGILQRYYADFSLLFLTPAILLCFIANEAFKPDETIYKVFIRTLLVLVTLSVLYSTLLCFVPETGWVSDIYPWAYQDIVEMVQFWT